MRLAFGAIVVVALFSAAARGTGQGTESAADRYDQLASSTQLDRKGAQPFHLKLDTQLYELDGSPSKNGTIEEWWVSPDEFRIEINSGSLHKVVATGETAEKRPASINRNSYLLDELLSQIVHPLSTLGPRFTETEVQREFGKTELSCFQRSSTVELGSASQPALVCCDPTSGLLRAEITDPEVVVRDSLGAFGKVNVALGTSILYSGRIAAKGTITTLQGFDPSGPGMPVLKPEAQAASAAEGKDKPVSLQSGVLAGHLLKKEPPFYPGIARMRHLQGTVVLHGLITKEGKVTSIFVLASPDESLSNAAMDAVRNWKYQPYLLNGQPVEVDTTFRVNFSLNRP